MSNRLYGYLVVSLERVASKTWLLDEIQRIGHGVNQVTGLGRFTIPNSALKMLSPLERCTNCSPKTQMGEFLLKYWDQVVCVLLLNVLNNRFSASVKN